MDNSIQSLTNQFHTLIKSQRFGHAHLLVCPIHELTDDVIYSIISLSLCSSVSHCKKCQSCRLLQNGYHPDLIQLSNLQRAIKVDDVRCLINFIYQAPIIARLRIVVIKAADLLNRSSANALLKIIEEPPQQVMFILSCESTSSVIPTIRSRATSWHIPIPLVSDFDWEALSKCFINNGEGKKLLLDDKLILMEQINTVYELNEQAFDVAHSWQKYPIYDLLWFLYLLHGWALRQNHFDNVQHGYFGNNEILLRQIQQIAAMIKLLRQGVAFNNDLMCETFLIGCRGTAI